MTASVLVLGLGNPLRGDDGVGPRLVEELTRRGLPEGARALDAGTGGLDLLRVMEGWTRVVIVDAANVGREPGQFVQFTPQQVHLSPAERGISLHNAGLNEVLALASAMGLDLPEITVFGVQPTDICWQAGLSPAVEAAIPALVDAVMGELES